MVDIYDFGAGYTRDKIIDMAASNYLSSSAVSQFVSYNQKGRDNPVKTYLVEAFENDINNAVCYGGSDHSNWFFLKEIICVTRDNIAKKNCGSCCEEKKENTCGTGSGTQLYTNYYCNKCCAPTIDTCGCGKTLGSAFQISKPFFIKWEDDILKLLPFYFVDFLVIYIAKNHCLRFRVEAQTRNEIRQEFRAKLSHAKMQDTLLFRNI